MNCEPHLFWGMEEILNCKGCSIEAVSDKDVIQAFVDELVVAIEMEHMTLKLSCELKDGGGVS